MPRVTYEQKEQIIAKAIALSKSHHNVPKDLNFTYGSVLLDNIRHTLGRVEFDNVPGDAPAAKIAHLAQCVDQAVSEILLAEAAVSYTYREMYTSEDDHQGIGVYGQPFHGLFYMGYRALKTGDTPHVPRYNTGTNDVAIEQKKQTFNQALIRNLRIRTEELEPSSSDDVMRLG